MNQILISSKIYVTEELKRKKRTYKILYTLSIIVLIVLIIYYILAEKNRNQQEAVGREILNQIDTTTVEEEAIIVALDDRNEIGNQEIVQIEQPDSQSNTITEPIQSQITTSDGRIYSTEAVFEYPKLGINYPVLSDENDKLLKISLCKYWGPNPNTIGNYCIVGHNYKSGKMFGKLSMASMGDEVTLTDLNGRKITYSIYNIYTVEPTDVSCTSQLTNGKMELTLITCTNYGKQRLVVKAREI